MRDLNRSSSCIPKSEDRRRPPYFERSENAAPIRRSSNGRSEAKTKTTFYTFILVKMSEANLIFCISCKPTSEDRRRPPYFDPKGRTRPLFADRATGGLRRSRRQHLYLSCSTRLSGAKYKFIYRKNTQVNRSQTGA